MWNFGRLKFFLTDSTRNEIPLSQRRISKTSNIWSNLKFCKNKIHINGSSKYLTPQLHCKDTIPNIRSKYSQNRNCAASVLISTFMYIYSHDRSAYSAAGKFVDRSWEHINLPQTHEYGNWDSQFLFWEHIYGIFFAVYKFT